MNIDLIYKWQELIGAFLGTFIPICFWFFVKWIEKREKHKEDLLFIEKNIVSNINALIDTHNTIKKFLNQNLKLLIEKTNERIEKEEYSADLAFFPDFFCNEITDMIFTKNSQSGYLENKLLQAYKMSKDFSLGVQDMRHQFKETVSMSINLALNKNNPVNVHNNIILNNLTHFKEFVEKDMLETNTRIYLKLLVETFVVLRKIKQIRIMSWRLKFSPSFKYFKNRTELIKFNDDIPQKIDEYIQKDVLEYIAKAKEKFDV